MGFMGLSCICDSDNASDAASAVVDGMAASLEKEFKETSNDINTPGYLNVALFYMEILLPAKSQYVKGNERLHKLAVKVSARLDRVGLPEDSNLYVQMQTLKHSVRKYIEESKKLL